MRRGQEHATCRARLWELGWTHFKSRWKGNNPLPPSAGGCREDRPAWELHSNGTSSNTPKLERGKFWLNSRGKKNHYGGKQAREQQPQKVAASKSLNIIKTQRDTALSNSMFQHCGELHHLPISIILWFNCQQTEEVWKKMCKQLPK